MLWPSLLLAPFAGLTALSGYSQRRKEKKLLAWGLPARAVVVSCSPVAGKSGGIWWNLEYSDVAGNRVKSSLKRNSMPQPGQEVLTVLYDPNKPQQCIIYPVARYRVGAPQSS